MNVIGMIFGKITLASAIRTACPLIIAASGGCFCHSVGVFNFAYECFMLSGAFFAAYGAHISGSFITGSYVFLCLRLNTCIDFRDFCI